MWLATLYTLIEPLRKALPQTTTKRTCCVSTQRTVTNGRVGFGLFRPKNGDFGQKPAEPSAVPKLRTFQATFG